MKLIEKECPNCGAGLSFTVEDTTCKCEYCKREFEIERDKEKKKLDDQYILSELKAPIKLFSYFTFGSFITHAIAVSFTFLIIIIILFGAIGGLYSSNNRKLIKSYSELTDNDFSRMNLRARSIITSETIGTTGEYVSKGRIERVNVYFISNEKRNYVIPVYKVVYKHFANSSDTHTVYIPISYKDVRVKGNSISLDDGVIAADKYYFNDNDYTYGYGDLDTLYDEVIKVYEKRYKVEKK